MGMSQEENDAVIEHMQSIMKNHMQSIMKNTQG